MNSKNVSLLSLHKLFILPQSSCQFALHCSTKGLGVLKIFEKRTGTY